MELLIMDVLHVITGHLPIADVLALSSTCKRLRSFVADSYVSNDVTFDIEKFEGKPLIFDRHIFFGCKLINNMVLNDMRFHLIYAVMWNDARNLASLSLDNMNLTSNNLREMKLPSAINYLGLMLNSISDFSVLRAIDVKRLNIGYNPVTNLSFLRGMHVTTLCIAGLKLSHKELCRLPYGNPIVNLDMGICEIRDLNFLKNFKGLQKFAANSTQLSDISALRQFADTLENVDIHSKALVDISVLASLQHVHSLRLRYAQPSTIVSISHMCALTHLDLSHTIIDSFHHVPKSVEYILITDVVNPSKTTLGPRMTTLPGMFKLVNIPTVEVVSIHGRHEAYNELLEGRRKITQDEAAEIDRNAQNTLHALRAIKTYLDNKASQNSS